MDKAIKDAGGTGIRNPRRSNWQLLTVLGSDTQKNGLCQSTKFSLCAVTTVTVSSCHYCHCPLLSPLTVVVTAAVAA